MLGRPGFAASAAASSRPPTSAAEYRNANVTMQAIGFFIGSTICADFLTTYGHEFRFLFVSIRVHSWLNLWSSPCLLQQLFHLGDDFRVFGLAGKVVEFTWVLAVIVKLDPFFAIVPFRVTPSFRANAAPQEPAGRVAPLHLRVGGTVPMQPGVVQHRSQARARQVFRRDQTAEIGDGGIDIERFHD